MCNNSDIGTIHIFAPIEVYKLWIYLCCADDKFNFPESYSVISVPMAIDSVPRGVVQRVANCSGQCVQRTKKRLIVVRVCISLWHILVELQFSCDSLHEYSITLLTIIIKLPASILTDRAAVVTRTSAGAIWLSRWMYATESLISELKLVITLPHCALARW